MNSGIVFAAAPYAQLSVVPSGLHFDVASIKINDAAPAATHFEIQPSGRLVAVNIPLRRLITEAYGPSEYLKSWEMAVVPARILFTIGDQARRRWRRHCRSWV